MTNKIGNKNNESAKRSNAHCSDYCTGPWEKVYSEANNVCWPSTILDSTLQGQNVNILFPTYNRLQHPLGQYYTSLPH